MLQEILTQLTTTTVVIAVAAWLLKAWISHQLEEFQAKNAHTLALELEAARAEWAKDVARLNVHEEFLHTRRVALIEEMHAEAVEAEFSLQNFLVWWWAVTDRETLIERGLVPPGHFDAGRDASMKERGKEFCERYLKINATLHRNAIFFDEEFIAAVRAAYEPFFDVIVRLDYEQLPPMPEEYEDVVETGRAPRRAVIAPFRELLGVTVRRLGEFQADTRLDRSA